MIFPGVIYIAGDFGPVHHFATPAERDAFRRGLMAGVTSCGGRDCDFYTLDDIELVPAQRQELVRKYLEPSDAEVVEMREPDRLPLMADRIEQGGT